MGGDGPVVEDGPFAYRDGTGFVVALGTTGSVLNHHKRGLRRNLGAFVPALPRRGKVGAALAQSRYDAAPWTMATDSFRGYLEGGDPPSRPDGCHNQVHQWISGDMDTMTSPNDPVFFLHHSNVDRIWTAWQLRNGNVYSPDDAASNDLKGHRLHDRLTAMTSGDEGPMIADVLDVRDLYEYDTLLDLIDLMPRGAVPLPRLRA
jgi:tyrosinase